MTTEVRQAARELTSNQQRVLTTRASRELSARRLEAEQRKFAAGTSTNFLVFQAQRDLAVARNNELSAILDYIRSKIDIETVQEVPLQIEPRRTRISALTRSSRFAFCSSRVRIRVCR